MAGGRRGDRPYRGESSIVATTGPSRPPLSSGMPIRRPAFSTRKTAPRHFVAFLEILMEIPGGGLINTALHEPPRIGI